METKNHFEKVLESKDVFVIAFGAMIGWGWVINSGNWLVNAGFIGSIVAFLIGGAMVMFVGLTYAELTAAMPQCGGEHVFSYRAIGKTGSFICTWAIILGYVATAAFEAASLPTVFRYVLGDIFDIHYLYSINNTKIYLSHVIFGSSVALLITIVNCVGVRTAAIFQRVFTGIIGAAGILLVIGSAINGSVSNIDTNLVVVNSNNSLIGGILSVTCMTPFMFMGFDVIPQAAEEIKLASKKIGKIMIFSIALACAWYLMIIIAVSYIMPINEIKISLNDGLVTADAMSKAFNWTVMGKVLIIGGLCGIITSWNSFIIGGSRAIYSMGESKMLPALFGKLHKKFKTPVASIVLCGTACILAPFFGKPALVWLGNAASFGCCVAYFIVSLSFLILRFKEPNMERPYKVRWGKFVGITAIALSGMMSLLYIIPIKFSSCTLVFQEWVVVGVWIMIGIIFYVYARCKYKKNFASIKYNKV